ncbi:MAG: sporulation protein YqfD [Clostridia bacterium]|nr:sporulation protein YqfD [Clostridia bacterium]
MWKNKKGGKGLIDVKYTYLIEGLNLDRFINSMKNKGITLYNIKKTSNKRLIVSVSYQESKIFFANAKELCYNIKKIKEKGLGLPLIKMWRGVGVLVGIIIFCFSTFFFNDFIYEISFSGSGSVYKREVLSYLNSVGVKEYQRFSSFDFERIEDGVLADNSNLSFVAIEKHGNTLLVDLALATDNVDRLDGNVYSLTSAVNGTIEKINVYRGTALVKKGDYVNKGDLLVDGYMTIKEQTVKINVLASLSIIAEEQLLYSSKKDNEQEKAELLARANFTDKEILECITIKEKQKASFIYKTMIKYRYIIYVG